MSKRNNQMVLTEELLKGFPNLSQALVRVKLMGAIIGINEFNERYGTEFKSFKELSKAYSCKKKTTAQI